MAVADAELRSMLRIVNAPDDAADAAPLPPSVLDALSRLFRADAVHFMRLDVDRRSTPIYQEHSRLDGPGQGHGTGPVDRLRHRDRGRGQHPPVLRARHRHDVPHLSAAHPRRARPAGGDDGGAAGRAARRRRAEHPRRGGRARPRPRRGPHPHRRRVPRHHRRQRPEALELFEQHHCHAVVTDVIMPEVSGPQLMELLHRRRPGLPALFMSGYSNGLLGTTHLLDDDIAFIEKPFTGTGLLLKLHDVLAAEPAPADEAC